MSLQIQLKKSAVSQKQPFASDLAVGELALNYNAAGPFLTCKDSAGNVRKLNNVWVSNSAPTGPSAGDLWLDTSATTAVLKVYKDATATWVDAITVPIATTSIFGKVQLASAADITNATAGKVVDAAQLQSKITAELSANPITLQGVNVVNDVTIGGDLTVNGTQTVINTQTLDVEDKNIVIGNVTTPSDATADGGGISLLGATTKTINWVDATDSWTSSENVDLASGKSYRINGTEVLSATALGSAVQITSANIPAGTIVDADINASAEIAVSKLADGAARQLLQTDAAGTGVEWTDNVDIPGTLDVTGAATFDSSVAVIGALTKSGNDVVTVGDTGTVTSTMIADGTIVDADVNASAAIAGTKISPDFGAQNVTTTGTSTAASFIPTSSTVPTNGVYLPAANSVALSTNGTGRLFVDANGNVQIAGSLETGVSSTTAQQQIRFNTQSTYAGQIYTNNLENLWLLGGAIYNGSNFVANTGTTAATMRMIQGAIRFETNSGLTPSGSFTPQERLRITSAGLVGIGTSSPAYTFDCRGEGAFELYNNTGGGSVLNFRPSAGDANKYNMSISSYDHGGGGAGTADGLSINAFDGVSICTGNSTARQERLRVTQAGNVGIGTQSPNSPLEVRSDGAGSAQILRVARQNGADAAVFRIDIDADANEIVYRSTGSVDGAHVWAGGTTERARIDSSGRLLVGTSSSIAGGLLQVGTNSGTAQANVQAIGSSNTANYWMLRSNDGGIVSSQDRIGGLLFRAHDGSSYREAASIVSEVDGTPGANDMPGRLVFSVTADGAASLSEAMRINNAGELLVGYTSDNGAYKLQVNSQIFATSATIATSDGRYKENVAALDGCVDLVKALRPVSFDWKAQEPVTRVDEDGETVVVREAHNFPDGKQVGFIAQEVEEVLADKPWLGSVIKQNVRPAVTDADGNELAPEEEFLGIAEGNLVAVLTSALKDAIVRIESLEAKVAALKA